MCPPASDRRWRSRLTAATVAVLLLAGCAERGDHTENRTSESSTGSSTSTVAADHWCDELESLLAAEDFTVVEIADAPEEVRGPLQYLAELETDGATGGTLARAVDAQARVEAWAHEHCGGEHPFCPVWVTVDYVIAASSLSDSPDEQAQAELEAFLDDVGDVLTEHAPAEMQEHVDTFLAFEDSVHNGSTPSDADERDAEAASDALDEWAWSEGCAGAGPPDDQEQPRS